MNRRIAVRALIIQNSKLLCFKLKAYDGAIAGDYWCLPGGTVEDGEALRDALNREMLEETNVKPAIGDLLFINHFNFNNREHLEFIFNVINVNDYRDLDPTSASHGDIEIAAFDFVDPKQVYILPAFLAEEDITAHIKQRRPVKIFTYLS